MDNAMTFPKPQDMHVMEIEITLKNYGIKESMFSEWSDEEARRIGELLIEWSKR
jgi:hypothetical protein